MISKHFLTQVSMTCEHTPVNNSNQLLIVEITIQLFSHVADI